MNNNNHPERLARAAIVTLAAMLMLGAAPLKAASLSPALDLIADDFSMAFLEKGLVALVSCCGFGAPTYVRWSYATSMENIREGLDRLEKFLAE